MISEKIKKRMRVEAIERMKLLEIEDRIIEKFENGCLTKVRFDQDTNGIYYEELTEEEANMVNSLEAEKNILIYYLIKDEGIWPDGCLFERYTLPMVNNYPEEYSFVKEECIGRCKTLPAYIVNTEEMDCSEFAEFAFCKVAGTIINIS